MTFVKNELDKMILDLEGPDGNAFVILGKAHCLANHLNLDSNAILNEMKSSDYNNLVKTFEKYFGEYVDIYGFNESEN